MRLAIRKCLVAAVAALIGAGAIAVPAASAEPTVAVAPTYCEIVHGQVTNRPPEGAGVCYGGIYVRNRWWVISWSTPTATREDTAPSPVQDPFRCDDNVRRDGGPCVAVGDPPVPGFGFHRATAARPSDLNCSYWDIINFQCGNSMGFLNGENPRILVRAVPMYVRSWLGLFWGPLYGSWVRDHFVWQR